MSQTAKVIVPGEAENEYKSSDIILVKSLMYIGHRPRRTECSGGVVTYIFEHSEIEQSEHDILTNKDIKVSLKDVWSGDQIWAMNLNRARNI